MQTQLQEAIAANGLLDYPVVLRVGRTLSEDLGWIWKTREGIETCVQGIIGIRGIKIRVIEDVKCIDLELEVQSFTQLEMFEKRCVEARLKRCAKDVSAISSIAGLVSVTRHSSPDRRAARRDSHLSGAQKWNREVIGVDVGPADPGERGW